jgi:hypothetical protein
VYPVRILVPEREQQQLFAAVLKKQSVVESKSMRAEHEAARLLESVVQLGLSG